MSMAKELYNLQGVATKLNLPPKWIKAKVKSGHIPCLQVGKRRMFFNLEAVQNAMAELAKGATNEQ